MDRSVDPEVNLRSNCIRSKYYTPHSFSQHVMNKQFASNLSFLHTNIYWFCVLTQYCYHWWRHQLSNFHNAKPDTSLEWEKILQKEKHPSSSLLRTVPPFVTAHICCASFKASITLSAHAKVNLLAHDDAIKRATKNAKTAFSRPDPVYVHLLKHEQQKNNIFIPTKR